jgi:hypothetical protein
MASVGTTKPDHTSAEHRAEVLSSLFCAGCGKLLPLDASPQGSAEDETYCVDCLHWRRERAQPHRTDFDLNHIEHPDFDIHGAGLQ